ncbi:30S ribosomal protein S17 [archaeon]|jgi:small subunit ribosomal protein S17|nr:30S ribosomal protein S17 [archaeon]MBT3730913.1 30S ribosomal protein S17 [archaeon]MBT4669848.1 30S ribosomal protein S17 [archaeon]MBT5030000.1 30S ribosomal protein S17 [archaeon]MBT5288101.1 30S ribosomal protein S17 [archaeon]
MTNKKSVGMGFELPKEKCEGDLSCPFHGSLKLRGRTFAGTVIKRNPHKTVTIEWPRTSYIQKYERYEKKRTRVKAHNPSCINAQIGDKVTIVETRPISKTKNFVIVKVNK